MKEKTNIKNVAEIETRFPTSVDFMLLGSCDLKCSFCFGPQHEMPAIQTDKAINIVNKLASNGVERVVFTGGEPTLIDDLPDILKAAKDRGLTTVLSTNGILLASNGELLDKIAPSLNWIALPLEGDTSEINGAMRTGFEDDAGVKHFETVLNLIPKIKEKYPELRIKLGTVVTKQNIDHVTGIPNLLAARKAIPDTWKLYQFSPSEYGKINYSSLEISDEEFEMVYEQARERALQAGIPNIAKHTNTERPGKHLFINPKGDALTVHSDTNDYFPIGNILSNFNEVANRWKSYTNNDVLTANFESTYPTQGF